MPCYHPIPAWYPDDGSRIKFSPPNVKRSGKTVNYKPHFHVPCNGCVGCRTEYSRQWAMRNLHEASLYADNSFITLTYDKKNLPQNNSLDKKAFPKFIRSLRQKNKGTKIRYYACGEYGDNFGRPHYHAILFNYFPPLKDKKGKPDLVKLPNKKDLYTSTSISDAWGNKGFTSVGAVTFDSAAYVSSYVDKKIKGKDKVSHYILYHPNTGELAEPKSSHLQILSYLKRGFVWLREPEFSLMSRGGRNGKGIAFDWFDKYKTDAYPKDQLHINGRKMKPPKYYDTQYEFLYPEEMELIKLKRAKKMEETAHLFTSEALADAERTHKARQKIYKSRKLK
jgi:hypothetical protein